MRKRLIAKKTANGWYVEITRTEIVFTESDILKIIRYEGLKRRNELSNDKKIYAD